MPYPYLKCRCQDHASIPHGLVRMNSIEEAQGWMAWQGVTYPGRFPEPWFGIDVAKQGWIHLEGFLPHMPEAGESISLVDLFYWQGVRHEGISYLQGVHPDLRRVTDYLITETCPHIIRFVSIPELQEPQPVEQEYREPETIEIHPTALVFVADKWVLYQHFRNLPDGLWEYMPEPHIFCEDHSIHVPTPFPVLQRANP